MNGALLGEDSFPRLQLKLVIAGSNSVSVSRLTTSNDFHMFTILIFYTPGSGIPWEAGCLIEQGLVVVLCELKIC